MSNIFDAFQRVAGERGETDPTVLPEATELLRLAESRTATKWQASHPVHQADISEQSESDFLQRTEAEAWPAEATESANPTPRKISSAWSDLLAGAPRQQISTIDESRLVCLSAPENPATEAFRLLGVRVRDLRRERPLKRLLITSSMPYEGKSVTAANLAATLATRTQDRVLLVEGDLRQPSLSGMFGVDASDGLSDCLQEKGDVVECILQLDGARMWLLPAGTPVNNPLDLLQSRKLSLILDELAAMFDWIVIDAPPVLPMADTTVWTRLSDAILFVVRQGTVEKQQLQKSLDAIDRRKLVGTVVNCSSSPTSTNYYPAGRQRT